MKEERYSPQISMLDVQLVLKPSIIYLSQSTEAGVKVAKGSSGV